jgi:DNA primase
MPPLAATRASLLGAATGPVEDMLREAVVLATLLVHPRLIAQFESQLDRTDFTGPGHARLRDLILTHGDVPDLMDIVRAQLQPVLDAIMAQPHVRNAPAVADGSDAEKAEFAVAQDLFLLQAERGRRREIEEAAQDIEGVVDEGLTWRIAKANEARFEAQRGPKARSGESVIAPNGVALDKDELEQSRRVFDNIVFEKGRRRD